MYGGSAAGGRRTLGGINIIEATVQRYPCGTDSPDDGWAFGDPSSDTFALGVAVDNAAVDTRDGDGDIVVVGATKGDIAEGLVFPNDAARADSRADDSIYSNANPSNSTTDAFVVRFDRNGTVVWWCQLGSTGDDRATSVAIDQDDGTVVVTGYVHNGSGTGAALNEAFVIVRGLSWRRF